MQASPSPSPPPTHQHHPVFPRHGHKFISPLFLSSLFLNPPNTKSGSSDRKLPTPFPSEFPSWCSQNNCFASWLISQVTHQLMVVIIIYKPWNILSIWLERWIILLGFFFPMKHAFRPFHFGVECEAPVAERFHHCDWGSFHLVRNWAHDEEVFSNSCVYFCFVFTVFGNYIASRFIYLEF